MTTEPQELYWDYLPFESELQLFNGRVGDLQARMRVRGTDKEAVDRLCKELMHAGSQIVRKHKTHPPVNAPDS